MAHTPNLSEILSAGGATVGGRRISFKREYRFTADRWWRFDFANPRHMIAIEVEGGIFDNGGGRHNRGGGFVADLEKYNTAASMGWIVLRFTTSQMKNRKRCAEHLALIIRAFQTRTKEWT